MIIQNYGQKREVSCTEAEQDIFHIIRSVCDDDNCDATHIELVRKSDSYVSAVMPSSQGYGDMDLARFKYTDRAKWIMFPSVERGSSKHRIQSPTDAADFDDLLKASIEIIKKYS